MAVTAAPLSLADLTRELGLAKSTTHRICGVLVDRAWAVRDADGTLRPRDPSPSARLAFDRAPDRDRVPHRCGRLPRRARRDDRARRRRRRRVPLHRDRGDLAARPLRHPHRLEVSRVRLGERTGRSSRASRTGDRRRALLGAAARSPRPAIASRGMPELRDDPRGRPRGGRGRELGRDGEGLYAASVPITNGAGSDDCSADDARPPCPGSHPSAARRSSACLREHGRRLSELVDWLPAYSARARPRRAGLTGEHRIRPPRSVPYLVQGSICLTRSCPCAWRPRIAPRRESRRLPRVRRAARRSRRSSSLRPDRGELEVELAACAICQSDIHYLEGAWGGPLPAVYGHEAAGVVAEVGPGVEGFAAGDHVVVTLIRSCGPAPPCASGEPALCETTFALDERGPLTARRRHARSRRACAPGPSPKQVVVDASQVVVIPADIPLDQRRAARLRRDHGLRRGRQHRRSRARRAASS